mgnify:CR=1 FL=1
MWNFELSSEALIAQQVDSKDRELLTRLTSGEDMKSAKIAALKVCIWNQINTFVWSIVSVAFFSLVYKILVGLCWSHRHMICLTVYDASLLHWLQNYAVKRSELYRKMKFFSWPDECTRLCKMWLWMPDLEILCFNCNTVVIHPFFQIDIRYEPVIKWKASSCHAHVKAKWKLVSFTWWQVTVDLSFYTCT